MTPEPRFQHGERNLLDEFIRSLETERTEFWRAGDLVAFARQAAEDDRKVAQRRAQARRRLYGIFAQAAMSTAAHVRQLDTVASTFGHETRFPTRPFSWFRAVRNAAERTQQDARLLADEAHERDLTVADLNAMGKDTPDRLVATGDCPRHGATVRVVIEGQAAARAELHGLVLCCPVCVAEAHKAETDGRDAERIGALE